jgi:hypothetical protein
VELYWQWKAELRDGSVSYNGLADELGLLGCDAVSSGEWFQMMGQNVVNYTPGTVSHRKTWIPKTELFVEFETNPPHR